jgi:hypothetical protein
MGIVADRVADRAGAKEGVIESIRAMTTVKLATLPWP